MAFELRFRSIIQLQHNILESDRWEQQFALQRHWDLHFIHSDSLSEQTDCVCAIARRIQVQEQTNNVVATKLRRNSAAVAADKAPLGIKAKTIGFCRQENCSIFCGKSKPQQFACTSRVLRIQDPDLDKVLSRFDPSHGSHTGRLALWICNGQQTFTRELDVGMDALVQY